MLSLFRTNQVFVNVLLIAYVLLLRSSTFFIPSATVFVPQGIFSFEIARWIGESHWIEPIIASIVVFIQGLMINILSLRYRFSEEQSLFAGLFYVLIASTCNEFLGLSSALLAITFLIISFFDFFVTYKKTVAPSHIFNVGFVLALGSMFQFSMSAYLLWAFVGLAVLRKGSFSEIAMVLIGFLTAYFLIGTYYFCINQYDLFWNEQFSKTVSFLDFKGQNTWISFGVRIFFFVLIGITIVSQGLYAGKKSIQAQKIQTVLYWSLIAAVFTLLFQANVTQRNLLLLAPALGIFIAYNFLQMSRQVAEAVHLLWIAAVLALQYHSFLGF